MRAKLEELASTVTTYIINPNKMMQTTKLSTLNHPSNMSH